MSMMTTMTSVLHRVLEGDWSSFPFPLYNLFVQGVLWPSWCREAGMTLAVQESPS